MNRFKQLMVMLLLFGAGVISPSNGVDDLVIKNPSVMLMETALIILVATIAILIFKQRKQTHKFFTKN